MVVVSFKNFTIAIDGESRACPSSALKNTCWTWFPNGVRVLCMTIPKLGSWL
jgi:hypothetical protein